MTPRILALGGVAACALLAQTAAGQCVPGPSRFCVAVGPKTASNPNPGGWTQAWYIDGLECKEISVVRGRAYEFKANSIAAIHNFYLSTSKDGGLGGDQAWTEGVVPPSITGNATMVFTVPFSAPDLLYYQCKNHLRMGWKIHVYCPADFDRSGFVDTDDFDAFVSAFIDGSESADFDQSGFVDTDDYDAFVNAFEAGC